MARTRPRRRRAPLNGEDRFAGITVDVDKGRISLRGDWISLRGAHARLEVTKDREEWFDQALQMPASATYRYEEIVIETPQGELVRSGFQRHGSKAQAKIFVRRVNEAAANATEHAHATDGNASS